MKTKTRSNKGIDIVLQEEKFYFPGETLRGHVIVHPKNPTKTNHIVVRFLGEVLLDKETITLFQKTKILPVSYEAGQSKATILAAKPHKFEFEFVVPQDVSLPSTMEIAKKVKVRYLLCAVQDRPMVPEALCAKTEYAVPILEYIDIESTHLARPQETHGDVLLYQRHGKYHIQISTQRTGFTRGDIVTMHIKVVGYEPALQKKAIEAQLVRVVDIRPQGRTIPKLEDVLHTSLHDLDILTPENPQVIVWKTAVPMSTPPTIQYTNGTTLRVSYRVRLYIHPSDPKVSAGPLLELHLPITIGTWPRTAIPIDDDDDDDGSVSYRNDSVFTETYDAPLRNHSHGDAPLSSSETDGVDRSNSNASRSSRNSYGSLSSAHSNQSWERPPSLSRTASLSTSLTMNTGSTMPDTPVRSVSPPSAFKQPTSSPTDHYSIHHPQAGSGSPPVFFHRQPQRIATDVADDVRRMSLGPRATHGMFAMTSSTSAGPIAFSPPRTSYMPDQHQHQHHQHTPPTVPFHHTTSSLDSSVPIHTLLPIASTAPASHPVTVEISNATDIIQTDTFIDDSDDEDSSADETDLLRIVEKRKKERQKRQIVA